MPNYGSIEAGKVEDGTYGSASSEDAALLMLSQSASLGDATSIKGVRYIHDEEEQVDQRWNIERYTQEIVTLFQSCNMSSKALSRGRKIGLIFVSALLATSFILCTLSKNWYHASTAPRNVINGSVSVLNKATVVPVATPSSTQQSTPTSASTSTSQKPPFMFVSREAKDPMARIVDLTMFPDSKSNGIRPFPTGAFWTNLVMRPSKYSGSIQIQNTEISYPIPVEPYALRWGQNEGLQISYPFFKRIVDSLDIQDPFFPHIAITAVEGISSREISYYDLLSVTMRFNSKNSSGGHSYSASPKIEAGFDAFVVQGSPYVTTKFQNATPNITPLSIFSEFGVAGKTNDMSTANACASIDPQTTDDWSIQLEGKQFLLVQPEGLKWILTSSDQITLSLDCASKRKLTTINAFSGVIRLALLPENSDFESSAATTLLKHAAVFPTGGVIVTDYKARAGENGNDIAKVTFSYNTDGGSDDDELLMYVLPHLVPLLNNTLSGEEFSGTLSCIKGQMTPVVGSSLTYEEALTNITFTAGRKIEDNTTKYLIRESLSIDIDMIPPQAEDCYGFGKEASRMANLALIADEIGENDLKVKAISILKDHMLKWLKQENKNALIYDQDFGGIITTEGLDNVMADFGNGRYDDHHFHYGYIIYACAILGKFDDNFVDEFGEYVDAIVADIANPDSKSSYFPVARHKSWFDGHSWASGLFSQGNGKNQESSSEAVNCYYAVYLWSLVRKSAKLNYFSRLLLASEIRGAQAYWHMGKNSTIYDEEFAKNYMVGNLGGLDVNSRTWFGTEKYYVHGIQLIPITSITEELFRESFVQDDYPTIIEPSYDSIAMSWKGFFVCEHAIVNPDAAWTEAQSLISAELDAGLSQSQVFYWIATRPIKSIPQNVTMDISSDGTDYSASCYLNSGCKSTGLSGSCCPTESGIYLGCCSTDPNAISDNSDKQDSGSNDSKSCSGNKGCASFNLQGDCCPTPNGVFLGCCS